MPSPKFLKRESDTENHPGLRENLRSARMPRSLTGYLAESRFYSIVTAVILGVALYIVFSGILGLSQIFAAFLSISAGAGTGYGIYRLFLFYPRIRNVNRADDIEDSLSHATAFMLALSEGGYGAIRIFGILNEHEDEYGEIAREAGAVERNANLLGLSPTEAIQDVAETTPSDEYRDFLNAYVSVIETGADVTQFLTERCNSYYEQAEERQEENLETLGILSEAYVIVLGLGPLLAIIILLLVGLMQQFPTNILYLIVYFGIPIGTVLYALILDMTAGSSMGTSGWKGEELDAVSRRREALERGSKGKLGRVKDSISGLRKKFFNDPIKSLWLSAPVALAAAVLGMYYHIFDITVAILAFAVISLVPLSLFYELESKKREKEMEAAPDLLISLSSSVSSGLSPTKALESLLPRRFKGMRSEIKDTKRDLMWGETVSQSFRNLSRRVHSGLISRVIMLMKRSSEVASNLSGILRVLAEDISIGRSLEEEKRRVTFVYALIIYFTFGIFLLTAFSMAVSFIPLLETSSAPAGAEAQGFNIGGVDADTIKTVFFHGSMIQGFCSGLLAGKLRKGEVLSGVKHSLVMLVAAWVAFTLFVL